MKRVIGVTGSIGSGKSYAIEMFKKICKDNKIDVTLDRFSELIEKIAVQFKKDFGDNFVYERPIIEENRVYSDYAKYSTMFYIIESGISSALTGHFDKDLNMLKEGFEIVNSNRRNSPLL